MRKILLQGLIIIGLFFSTWYLLNKVNWMTAFNIEHLSNKTEEKLGKIFWELFNTSEKEVDNPFIENALDSILNKISISNNINKNKIKLHVLNKNEINAFTLPDGHIVIYSGLILATENEAELCGVICHELAHIEQNHVIKKMIKEVGLTAIISITTGNSGSEIINETAKLLSSSAYDRKLEKEADIIAVNYLIKSKIDPESFAEFLFKLSEINSDITKYNSLISSHPELKSRSEYIIEYSIDKKNDYESILSKNTWDKIKEILKN